MSLQRIYSSTIEQESGDQRVIESISRIGSVARRVGSFAKKASLGVLGFAIPAYAEYIGGEIAKKGLSKLHGDEIDKKINQEVSALPPDQQMIARKKISEIRRRVRDNLDRRGQRVIEGVFRESEDLKAIKNQFVKDFIDSAVADGVSLEDAKKAVKPIVGSFISLNTLEKFNEALDKEDSGLNKSILKAYENIEAAKVSILKASVSQATKPNAEVVPDVPPVTPEAPPATPEAIPDPVKPEPTRIRIPLNQDSKNVEEVVEDVAIDLSAADSVKETVNAKKSRFALDIKKKLENSIEELDKSKSEAFSDVISSTKNKVNNRVNIIVRDLISKLSKLRTHKEIDNFIEQHNSKKLISDFKKEIGIALKSNVIKEIKERLYDASSKIRELGKQHNTDTSGIIDDIAQSMNTVVKRLEKSGQFEVSNINTVLGNLSQVIDYEEKVNKNARDLIAQKTGKVLQIASNLGNTTDENRAASQQAAAVSSARKEARDTFRRLEISKVIEQKSRLFDKKIDEVKSMYGSNFNPEVREEIIENLTKIFKENEADLLGVEDPKLFDKKLRKLTASTDSLMKILTDESSRLEGLRGVIPNVVKEDAGIPVEVVNNPNASTSRAPGPAPLSVNQQRINDQVQAIKRAESGIDGYYINKGGRDHHFSSKEQISKVLSRNDINNGDLKVFTVNGGKRSDEIPLKVFLSDANKVVIGDFVSKAREAATGGGDGFYFRVKKDGKYQHWKFTNINDLSRSEVFTKFKDEMIYQVVDGKPTREVSFKLFLDSKKPSIQEFIETAYSNAVSIAQNREIPKPAAAQNTTSGRKKKPPAVPVENPIEGDDGIRKLYEPNASGAADDAIEAIDSAGNAAPAHSPVKTNAPVKERPRLDDVSRIFSQKRSEMETKLKNSLSKVNNNNATDRRNWYLSATKSHYDSLIGPSGSELKTFQDEVFRKVRQIDDINSDEYRNLIKSVLDKYEDLFSEPIEKISSLAERDPGLKLNRSQSVTLASEFLSGNMTEFNKLRKEIIDAAVNAGKIPASASEIPSGPVQGQGNSSRIYKNDSSFGNRKPYVSAPPESTQPIPQPQPQSEPVVTRRGHLSSVPSPGSQPSAPSKSLLNTSDPAVKSVLGQTASSSSASVPSGSGGRRQSLQELYNIVADQVKNKKKMPFPPDHMSVGFGFSNQSSNLNNLGGISATVKDKLGSRSTWQKFSSQVFSSVPSRFHGPLRNIGGVAVGAVIAAIAGKIKKAYEKKYRVMSDIELRREITANFPMYIRGIPGEKTILARAEVDPKFRAKMIDEIFQKVRPTILSPGDKHPVGIAKEHAKEKLKHGAKRAAGNVGKGVARAVDVTLEGTFDYLAKRALANTIHYGSLGMVPMEVANSITRGARVGYGQGRSGSGSFSGEAKLDDYHQKDLVIATKDGRVITDYPFSKRDTKAKIARRTGLMEKRDAKSLAGFRNQSEMTAAEMKLEEEKMINRRIRSLPGSYDSLNSRLVKFLEKEVWDDILKLKNSDPSDYNVHVMMFDKRNHKEKLLQRKYVALKKMDKASQMALLLAIDGE